MKAAPGAQPAQRAARQPAERAGAAYRQPGCRRWRAEQPARALASAAPSLSGRSRHVDGEARPAAACRVPRRLAAASLAATTAGAPADPLAPQLQRQRAIEASPGGQPAQRGRASAGRTSSTQAVGCRGLETFRFASDTPRSGASWDAGHSSGAVWCARARARALARARMRIPERFRHCCREGLLRRRRMARRRAGLHTTFSLFVPCPRVEVRSCLALVLGPCSERRSTACARAVSFAASPLFGRRPCGFTLCLAQAPFQALSQQAGRAYSPS